MTLIVRDAKPDDAVAGCEVMCRSIAELCVADHRGDPVILERWLGNKTPDNFNAWIAQPGNSLMVAVENERILAVGSVTDVGEITLNYVSPDARFRGVSRAMLAALEMRAADRGCTACSLKSTQTARRFYLANGYAEAGQPAGHFGTTAGYPMLKALGEAGA
ncbi:MAG: GNAT family N-acetyltransferase [Hyphomicrobiaceae bacterium]